MVIFVFGNPDLKMDSLPIKILPGLKERFPEIEFKILDPNEEWEMPQELIIIDTVVGIKNIKVFESLKDFTPAPNISMHDFDAYANLRFLEKLGKIKNVKIIGVPPELSEEQSLSGIADIVNRIYKRRKKLRLPKYNYSQGGYYFVTICTKDRKCLFGEVINREMRLSQFGKIVEQQLFWLVQQYGYIKLDIHAVMPNHLHVIIVIDNNVGNGRDRSLQMKIKSLSEIVGAFKTTSSKLIHQNGFMHFQWQKSFYDHVIRDEKSLEKIREYIQNNPLQWELDEENPNNLPK